MKKDSFGLPDPGLSSVKRDSFLAFMRYFSRFETFPVFAGQAPKSLPGERRKSRSPHEALQGPSRIKEKYRPFPGFRRGSLPPSRSRGTPLSPGDDPFFKNHLKDSREAPMAASGQMVRIEGKEGIAFAG